MNLKVSLVMTTYNWPEALAAVLDTVASQQQLPHEVLIADDGSDATTRDLINRYQHKFPCPIVHIWHEDCGYQPAKIRNKAVASATGNYLVFIDSDCLLRPDFILQHSRLSRPEHFISGNRVLLSQAYTDQVLKQNIDVVGLKPFSLTSEQVNRRWSLLPIPMGLLRNMFPRSWKGVKTCNMSLYADDFIACNGFEEKYEGWGYEDSDLAVRLLRSGLRRISGRFSVTVIHLWHNTNKSSLEEANWNRLKETLGSNRQRANAGLDQHFDQDKILE